MRLRGTALVVSLHFVAYSLLLIAMKAVPNGPFVMVVSDPRHAADAPIALISRAGGQFVEATRFPWLSVAYSEAPDFASRLRQSGAVFVVNYPGAAGCRGRSS